MSVEDVEDVEDVEEEWEEWSLSEEQAVVAPRVPVTTMTAARCRRFMSKTFAS
jgi:hypothetical protein